MIVYLAYIKYPFDETDEKTMMGVYSTEDNAWLGIKRDLERLKKYYNITDEQIRNIYTEVVEDTVDWNI